MNEIRIFAPSYRRADALTTHLEYPSVVYVVAASEADQYRAAGVNVWAVPDSVQGNLCRVRNYILDNAGTPFVLLLDDDLRCIRRFTKRQRVTLTAGELQHFLEVGFSMAIDLGARLWGVNCSDDNTAYYEYLPIGLTKYIGGPFQAHILIDNPIRYDERLPLKEDYDITLQHLKRYRITLRFNAYHYLCDQHSKPGGCAAYRTVEREREQFNALQRKWGSKIVRRDGGVGPNSKRHGSNDINPILKMPIPGV